MPEGTPRSADVVRDTIRGATDERLWVRLTQVKADKRELHERFIHDILRPAVEQVAPAIFRHVRFLHPTEPNEDGTYTYIFLMDPLIEGADYDIETVLIQAYGKEKAQEYKHMWDESVASPQSGYELIQSSW